MMRNWWWNAMMVGVLAVSAGCIESTTLVYVKKDGSGTVTQVTYMGKAMQEMMQQMMAGMAGAMAQGMAEGMDGVEGATVKVTPPDMGKMEMPDIPIDEAKLRAKAKDLGEDVEFVSAKKVQKEDGSKGVKVVYAFSDISKLKLSMDPDMPEGGAGGAGMMMGGPGGPGGPGAMMGGPPPGAGAPAEKKPITFEFEQAGTSTLTIHIPQDEPEEAAEPVTTPGMPDGEGMDGAPDMPGMPGAEEMMKQMFAGFRVWMMVMVEGEISDSNATHVQILKKTGKKCLVTLVDMNLGELMKMDESKLKGLSAMGPAQDMATAMQMMKDFPGLKIEPQKTVTVTF